MKRRLSKWLKAIGAVVLICFFIYEILRRSKKMNLRSHEVLEIEKCPACFGEDLCPEFFHGTIQLKDFALWQSLFNEKNIYFGHYKGKDVVLKKLAHDKELLKFERRICELITELTQRIDNCDNTASNLRILASLWSYGKFIDYSDLKANLPPEIETFACVKTQNLIDFLNRKHLKSEHFLTMAFVNPEPLIAMTFPYEEGWPFPKYYGACGRFVVLEKVAVPLSHFTSVWPTKARLALQVLQMAIKMTHNDPILYLTDWSLDNFAVSNINEVKLIDLENIILGTIHKDYEVFIFAPNSSK